MGGPAPAPAPPPESAEMVQEILLKLPTRDVMRCCCVSKLWRSVAADPTFRTLHAEAEADHVSAAPPEALLVTVTREPGRPDEASFFRVSSPKPTLMPHRVTIPSGYRLSNICNGLLCFSLVRDSPEAPPFICNPVTGETATVPKAPPPVGLPVPGGKSG
ncbi:F-box protein At5g65850-like [Aegilops tauschii subsp. strangulata]|uniref:F-box protein At5g65850-like n=1 Tax=Aegilops tauschii subsp. strangulata TaxID=200361 RepID=UPI00098B83B4|nr:F-box protein At5g65850-like [Aegilops tauschii subsp. strangulata]